MRISKIALALGLLLGDRVVRGLDHGGDKIKFQVEVMNEDELLSKAHLKKHKKIAKGGKLVDLKEFERFQNNILEKAYVVEEEDKGKELAHDSVDDALNLRRSVEDSRADEEVEGSADAEDNSDAGAEEDAAIKIVSTEESNENDVHMVRKIYRQRVDNKEVTYCYMIFTFNMDLDKISETSKSEMFKSLDSMPDYLALVSRGALSDTETILEDEHEREHGATASSLHDGRGFSGAELLHSNELNQIDLDSYIRTLDDMINRVVSRSEQMVQVPSIYPLLIEERNRLYHMELDKSENEDVSKTFATKKHTAEQYFLYEALTRLNKIYAETEASAEVAESDEEVLYEKLIDLTERVFECHDVLKSTVILDYFVLKRLNGEAAEDASVKSNEGSKAMIRTCVNFLKFLIDNTSISKMNSELNKAAEHEKAEADSDGGDSQKPKQTLAQIYRHEHRSDSVADAESEMDQDVVFEQDDANLEADAMDAETKHTAPSDASEDEDEVEHALMTAAEDAGDSDSSILNDDPDAAFVEDELEDALENLDVSEPTAETEDAEGTETEKEMEYANSAVDADDEEVELVSSFMQETGEPDESNLIIDGVDISDETEEEHHEDILNITDLEQKTIFKKDLTDMANEMEHGAPAEISYIENDDFEDDDFDDLEDFDGADSEDYEHDEASLGNADGSADEAEDAEDEKEVIVGDDEDDDVDYDDEEEEEEEEEEEDSGKSKSIFQGFKDMLKKEAKKGLKKLVTTGAEIAKDAVGGLVHETKGAVSKLTKKASQKINSKLNKSGKSKSKSGGKGKEAAAPKKVKKHISKDDKKGGKKSKPAVAKAPTEKKLSSGKKDIKQKPKKAKESVPAAKAGGKKRAGSGSSKAQGKKKLRKGKKSGSFLEASKGSEQVFNHSNSMKEQVNQIISKYEELKDQKKKLMAELDKPAVSDKKIIRSFEKYMDKKGKHMNKKHKSNHSAEA